MSDVMPDELKPDATAHPPSRAYGRPRLTERRKQILKFLHHYAECHGWAASIEEVAKEVGASHFTAQRELGILDKLDYIVFEGSRQIKVLQLP
jgi:SOS-response transcriptional repressor LexA